VRFKNPMEGMVIFEDTVKGKISIANKELDDLIIARSDGTPNGYLCRALPIRIFNTQDKVALLFFRPSPSKQGGTRTTDVVDHATTAPHQYNGINSNVYI
jgi:hypothetical protein